MQATLSLRVALDRVVIMHMLQKPSVIGGLQSGVRRRGVLVI